MKYDAIIVGAGAAGLFCAIEAENAGAKFYCSNTMRKRAEKF
jgi:predicted flavoprotein YhiN